MSRRRDDPGTAAAAEKVAVNGSPASTPATKPKPSTSPVARCLLMLSLDPKTLKVVRKIIALTDGRDKAMKFVQYSGKILLWLWLYDKNRHPVSAPRLAALVSALSTTRKMIRLAHVVEPASDFTDFLTGRAPPPAPGRPIKDHLNYRLAFFGAAVGVLNDFADDVYCLAKVGALDKRFLKPSEKWANRFWLAGIVVDVISTADDLIATEKHYRALRRKLALQSEADGGAPAPSKSEAATLDYLEIQKLEDKRYWLRMTLLKFLMDGVFCSWDVFELKGSEGWQICSGWLSGVLSGYKLWNKTAVTC